MTACSVASRACLSFCLLRALFACAPSPACRAVGRAVARGAQTRAFSGLKDQDRIFQNIYGEHDTSIQGAMRRGDWYNTDKIVQKVPLPALV